LEAQLVTSLDVGGVVSHYAGQLEQLGWTLFVEQERDSCVWSTWTYRANDMPDRYGILFLSIWPHPGMPMRGAAAKATERPEIVDQYWLEVRTAWRADIGPSPER
jgi:hypothetical protein